MRAKPFIVLCYTLVLGSSALNVEKRDQPSVLKLALQKTSPQKHDAPLQRANKRQGTVETADLNYQSQLLYIVELLVGTPPQQLFVQLDTGSSDLIVETPSSDICSTTPPNPCTDFGAYTANSSSTYHYIDSDFQIIYGGGDGATGDWGSDTVSIGGAALTNAQFGVMYSTTVRVSVLGVSYPIIESRQSVSHKPAYPNLPMLLVQQKYIASRAFSLWTNDDRSSAGTLLFGGIDTSKFSGQLVTINLVSSLSGTTLVVDFTIMLQGVAGTDDNGNPYAFTDGTVPVKVLMDSGTTLTLLPQAVVNSIWQFVGATPNPSNQNQATIPCSEGRTSKTINLVLQGITITVPISQLVFEPNNSGPQATCLFGIGINSRYVLGDTVLAAMYVVYDLDTNQVSLAPTIFNSTAPEHILQIMAGPNGVPDRVKSTTSKSLSSSSSIPRSSTISTSSSSSSSSYSSTLSSSLSTSKSPTAIPISSALSKFSTTSRTSTLLTTSILLSQIVSSSSFITSIETVSSLSSTSTIFANSTMSTSSLQGISLTSSIVASSSSHSSGSSSSVSNSSVATTTTPYISSSSSSRRQPTCSNPSTVSVTVVITPTLTCPPPRTKSLTRTVTVTKTKTVFRHGHD